MKPKPNLTLEPEVDFKLHLNLKRNLNMEVGTWKLEFGRWNAVAGIWKLEPGTWKMKGGSWKLEFERLKLGLA
eukprot:822574-Lingulodinium_polyedra.AAC.1